ncbi:MAG: hypothetical protein WC525_09950 [Candidatus Thermoplasmatota archaeon]
MERNTVAIDHTFVFLLDKTNTVDIPPADEFLMANLVILGQQPTVS